MDTRGVEITWYGHGTWGLRDPGGTYVLVDPWLSGPTVPAVLREPAGVDVILVTHGHGDHVADVGSVQERTGAAVLAKGELADLLGARGVEATGFNVGGTVERAGIRFTMTQAVHSSSVEGPDGLPLYAGEPVGYVVTFSSGFRVYQSGDTAAFGDMALIGEMYRPDLAILSIGDHYTMGPLGAAHAVRLLGVGDVIGGHWGTFPVLTGTPLALEAEVARLGLAGVTVHHLEPGDTLR